MKKIYLVLSIVAVLGLIAAPSSAYNARAWDTVTFSGQATGVLVVDGNTNPIFASTNSLPPEGGELDANIDAISEDTVQTGNIDSVTTGFDEQAESRVSASSVVLLPGTDNEITADFAGANTIATCDSTTGNSVIDNLIVEGQTIEVTGEANQEVTLSDGSTLIINEQTSTDNSIKVNALHLIRVDGSEVIVSSAESDINCAIISQECSKVTGGGFITGVEDAKNHRANFGFNARPDLKGHLNYVDHTIKLHVKSIDDLTDFTCVQSCPDSGNEMASEGARDYSGNAKLNDGSIVSYHVCVEDNGEPGRGDWFQIDLSNGYSNAGFLEGGNIQVHKN